MSDASSSSSKRADDPSGDLPPLAPVRVGDESKSSDVESGGIPPGGEEVELRLCEDGLLRGTDSCGDVFIAHMVKVPPPKPLDMSNPTIRAAVEESAAEAKFMAENDGWWNEPSDSDDN